MHLCVYLKPLHARARHARSPWRCIGIEHQAGGSASSRAQGQAKPVPDRLVGELARFACRSGSKGMDKVVTDFTAVHPEASKRQVEKKIQARKDLRADATENEPGV